ncbi:Uncharacterized protein OS=Singulisphaera acidiphila (strain ATCC BAA-1392 / DSM 18658 / VKM B-2454 / MOB10) GN=Sinac_6530 PE=4 SV=1 [Gemmataceae bacterium]|nr:Uncharacterized protein OS=Singulisphaera acidiphila (strain ATCC BAA-1392 / DSM 18658 / VKM B-2454 / MOB10) GN=Sinac_6530 PE=4 SV=1 [Gemmataceae bacterium]VTT98708.1 Uncharacterized protein OS=Singulisphaera acidiphila (strain ATCC BAA-1392 / DSM 18658 / VKM B-2454 / MOB10) GN=Sinac_6530 PE=4 SV=1 [Gemmataceae bacterium]
MAAVLDQKSDPASKFSSQVDEQIAQATSRIRVHDLVLGGLTLASMVAVYAAAMISLDKSLNLPEWVRQLSLAGFGAAFAAVAYLMVFRPLKRRINPLYAAARVEDTIDDAKNVVMGYVDATERGSVHGAVRAAISAKAAKAVGGADVNRAVDHRSLIVAGGVLVALLVTLAVLFFVFRPTQFVSLAKRAFVPFTPTAIATRTQITLIKPEPLEPTLTTGQTITVAVTIGGKVPARTDPARVRLLIRHNPTDPNYEELPLQEGDTSRDWALKMPEYLVQNGFWYKVAAGDAETPEYKVTVRSLPLFTDFDVSYEYPKYTRKPADKGTDPNLRAYRGTKITMHARTNREVKDGLLKFDGGVLPGVVGKPVPGRQDTLAFSFTATEAANYRLFMQTTTGERNADAPRYSLALDADNPPRVEVVKPEEAEITLPANGQLAVDGTVGDDFGIDKVRLRLKVGDRDLAPVPYEGGKSFFRPKDATWPNDLAYKGSVDLAKLKYADGQMFETKEGMVVEFWLEAIDNCTETKPVEGWGDKPQAGQVGRSESRRVTLTAPKVEPEDKQQLDDQKLRRRNEEQQHNAQQQRKLDNEERPQPQQPQDQGQQKKNPDDKGGEQPKNGDQKGGEQPKGENPPKQDGKQDNPMKKDGDPNGMGTPEKNPMDKGGDSKNPPDKKDGTGASNPANDPKMPPDPKVDPTNPPEGKKGDDGMGGKSGQTDPKMPQDNKTDTPPRKGDNTGTGGMGETPKTPETAPMPKSDEQKKSEQEAQRVQDELNKNKAEGGDAKQNPEAGQQPQDRTDPAQQKPQQPMAGNEQDSQPKDAPKQPDPKDPQAPKGDQGGAAQSKPEGKLDPPPDKNGAAKPQPKQDGPKGEKGGDASERREEPLGGNPGEEKPEPKAGDSSTQPKNTEPKGGDPKGQPGKDPKSGSTAKPPTDQKQGGEPKSGDTDPKGGQNKPNPAEQAGNTKPNVEPARGQDKNPGAKPEAGQRQPADQGEAGDAKPQQAPPSGEKKPEPKNGGASEKQPDASEHKPEPKDATDPKGPKGTGGASETKPEPKKPTGNMGEAGEDKAGEPGADKPQPKQGDPKGGNNTDPTAKKSGTDGGKKLDEKQLKELEQAAKDLNSADPQKRKDAQDKLDKAIGEDKRKELEQTAKDLQSDDPAKRAAAEKKIEDARKQAQEQAGKGDERKDGPTGEPKGKDGQAGGPRDKGKELTQEDIAELAKKAGDLNSKDDKKRADAEKEFDKKIGKEAREELQKELAKKQPTGDPADPKGQDDLKKQIEEQARKNPPKGKGDKTDEFTPGGGATAEPPRPEDPTDPKNKLKTAQLRLEEFEKNRYNKDLQDKLGWTQEQYDAFLKAQAERLQQLEKEAAKQDEDARTAPPPGDPTIKLGNAGKIETLGPGFGTGATGTGAVFAPPGFEKAREDFAKGMRELKQKK